MHYYLASFFESVNWAMGNQAAYIPRGCETNWRIPILPEQGNIPTTLLSPATSLNVHRPLCFVVHTTFLFPVDLKKKISFYF